MGKQVKRVPQDSPTAFAKEDGVSGTGARPMSEITGGPQGGTLDEDQDGLDEVARALRDAAEGSTGRRPLGE